MEVYALEIFLRYFLYVLLVLPAHHDVLDSCPLGCQNLLLDSAYREHFAAEGNLAGHGCVGTHLALGDG